MAGNGFPVLDIDWPVSFTGNVELFSCTNLVQRNWQVISPPMTTAGRTGLCWTDTNSSHHAHRFYRVENADRDTDGDSLSDARETYIHQTLPDTWDSDGDGLGDGFEITHGLDPLSIPGRGEADRDLDCDGLPDALEQLFFGDLTQSATDDWDEDGLLNEEEFCIVRHHNEPYPIRSEWAAAPSNALSVAWSNRDEGFEQVDIGFAFPFFDRIYTNVHVGVNGTCSFGSAYGAWNKVGRLPNGDPHALAAPFWSDLERIHGTAKCFSRIHDTGASFVITWEDMSFYDRSASSLNFQAELFEDGNIVFRYGEMEYAGVASAASVGLQGHAGNEGTCWRYSNNLSGDITNGLALLFPPKASMIQLISYPDRADSDDDGIDDQFETESRLLNPMDAADASRDWDLDGVTNLREFHFGTALDLIDTDGDGLTDGVEITAGFNPTDPLDPAPAALTDMDGDGLVDWWELHYFGNLQSAAQADHDGDSLANDQEYTAGTNPFSADTDGDGLADDIDAAPLASGPRIFFTAPKEGATVQGVKLTVEGRVLFGGSVESVRIGNTKAFLEDEGKYWSFSATIDMPPEGRQTLVATASGYRGSALLQGKAKLAVRVDSLPPRLHVLSALRGAVFTNRYVHFTVQTDDDAPVTANGAEMARDGYVNYAWVELAPGANTITMTSTDQQTRTSAQTIEVYCDVPPDDSEDPPADADQDGVSDRYDPAPEDPSVSGSISFSSHRNGSMFTAEIGSVTLEKERSIALRGSADADRSMQIRVHPENTLRGCDRIYEVSTGDTGLFEQEIRLFPGINKITTTSGHERNVQYINFEVPPSPMEFQARWGPEEVRMLSVYSHSAKWGGGVMDLTRSNGQDTYICSFPPAGVYKSWMVTYRFREPWYSPLHPDDTLMTGGHATIDMLYGGKVLYTESTTFPYVWNSRFNFHHSTLDVAFFQTGSIIFHSGNETGGYIVDENGKRDMAPQGMYIGENGWSTLYFDPEPANEWSGDVITNHTENLALTGPNDTEDVVLQAGLSARFHAGGTFRPALGGAPNDQLCAIFKVAAVEGSLKNAFIDASGIFTAMEAGHYQVGIKYGSVLKTPTEFYTTNDVPPIDVYVVDPRLVPDYNRDGVIGPKERSMADEGKVLAFWINDDDDSGDISKDGNDVPGQGGWFDNANYEDSKVNGRSDLLDFFPVWLDLHDTLAALPTAEGAEYRLFQDDNAVRFVYTGLTVEQASAYRTAEGSFYGPAFTQNAYEADTIRVTESGVALNSAFLDRIKANPDKGVVLIEGIKPSTKPLRLEVWKEGKTLAKCELNLSLSAVENMYRWINLRNVAGGKVDRPTNLDEPSNLPDSMSNGKNFVFVHGYSVHEKAARAWNAEMFKRLFQAGSRAMYTAVTWKGNDSQIWGWIPFLGGSTPDYYENVENAFTTAFHLATQVAGLPGEKVIAGHSLGNMLVSSAIADHALRADKYFMLNAAVAMEAYHETLLNQSTMLHPSWQMYSNRLWASQWHKLFPAEDNRYQLTWAGRFKSIPNAINYYSSTEDVLANSDGALPPPGRVQAWVCQEMRKGTTLIWLGPGNAEAGWGFNPSYDIITGVDMYNQPILARMPPSDANILPDAAIRSDSFFNHFDDEALYDDFGSAFLLAGAADVRYSPIYQRLLADAIPALSNPAGRNDLGEAVMGNRDYMTYDEKTGFRRGLYKDGNWPRKEDDWWHSDIKDVAYPYNYKVFEQIIREGGLK